MKIDPTRHLSRTMLKKPVKEFASSAPLTFSISKTVGEVQEHLYTLKEKNRAEYFYILEEDGTLAGIISTRDLLYAPPQTELIDLVDPDVHTLRDIQPLESGLSEIAKYKLLALPIIDQVGSFIGVLEVTPDIPEGFFKSKPHQFRTIKDDLFQFIGFSIQQRKLTSTWVEYKYRMPWLLCNLIGGIICAVIGEAFQETLLAFVVLALLVPLVLTLSESIAIQSMTISLRFLHFNKIHWKEVWKRIFVESKTSLMLGITSALLIACFYFAWSTQIMPIIAIGISLIAAMTFSAGFGALFPITLHALRLDPKVAAGPLVLMIADILTVAIYYGLSTLILL